MKLTMKGISDRAPWENAGIRLPSYDVESARKKAKEQSRWVHFGIGNIFRVFIGGLADDLLSQGLMEEGLTCVEAYDFDIAELVDKPHDNLCLSVILKPDGSRDHRVLGSLAEVIKASPDLKVDWQRLKTVFSSKSLQLVSLTVTEKAYALTRDDGAFLPLVQTDINNGPENPRGLIAILTALLHTRYQNGQTPLALVSMDNCAHNGAMLKNAVMGIASEWQRKSFVEPGFLSYISDSSKISFPGTMIDKITPRPSPLIAEDLKTLGMEGVEPVITNKQTYIAPFVNAESPQYLVIEDAFPNGRPEMEKGKGVYQTDLETVNLCEKMKVTACLNPVHSALGPLGVVLGQAEFAKMLNGDPVMLAFAKKVAFDEGIPMLKNPRIISPEAFTDELFQERFVNEYLGDTNLRLSTDVSQGLSVRFGETIEAYARNFGTAEGLTAIPLGIAGWFRYLLGFDDAGKRYELAPDPLAMPIHEALKGVILGQPDTFTTQLQPFLSNERLFSCDLYQAGLGEKIEAMFREMIGGIGAAKTTIQKYIKG